MDKEERISQPNSAQSDDAAIFSPVLTILNLRSLPTLCALTRKASADFVEDPEAPIEPIVVESSLFGSYHALFPIRFQDGLRWILKIPACGTPEQFTASAASALQSEALTMKLIQRETSVPIPDVFAFSSTLDNELGVPYILMKFMPGKSLYDCWFDMKVSKEERRLRRKNTLEDIAQAMAELSKFSFSTGGALMYDAEGNLAHPGPLRFIDHQAMLERLGQSDDDDIEPTLYFEAGPFTDPQDFYLLSLNQAKEPEQPFHKGMWKLLYLLLQWIPTPQSPTFVLTHPDLNFQNVLVSEDGRVQALIDWDGVAAVPRLVGNEKFPSWLTRDWDPAMYAWNEEMEKGIEQDTVWEDSPETLVLHRREYSNFMERYQSLRGQSLPSSPAVKESSITQKSLFVENLVIAAENPLCRFEILNKFVEKIVELARANSLDCISNKYQDLEIFDITDNLVTGEMEQEMLNFLRKSFDSLLSQNVM
ncbi:hypothetical protein D8B26_007012 [Coccidioides posadasii str. Silveira]|uniref:Aminoglycoside phosphotransferase domain-containing protein n=1 Tax=Coccidioides posadasii (strain RMSCC 757 / Silveira) TaxID=443226 RepID=E9DGE9_COCPS|nr:conserved hypothetical protein [Coccidioides posadasii str. Silveira]QVM12382.1 hypothetical protein D8B26_007012 [Coccidioides posadasii str. Silveira]